MDKKVLVVDDEQDIVDLISYNLQREGYSVSSASDGLEALQVAAKVRPDLVILDIRMGGEEIGWTEWTGTTCADPCGKTPKRSPWLSFS